jgi:hypothetical protein
MRFPYFSIHSFLILYIMMTTRSVTGIRHQGISVTDPMFIIVSPGSRLLVSHFYSNKIVAYHGRSGAELVRACPAGSEAPARER